MYDVLIKNGTVIDGTGETARKADIALKDDVISAIDETIDASSEMTIDASNKLVMPGFIDVTSHSDTAWTIFDYPGQESLVSQGITTVMGGNCGASLALIVSAEAI